MEASFLESSLKAIGLRHVGLLAFIVALAVAFQAGHVKSLSDEMAKLVRQLRTEIRTVVPAAPTGEGGS
jgi:hypothetical protein